MKFINCPECGRKVPKENYCIYCGIRLEKNNNPVRRMYKPVSKAEYCRCPECGGIVKANNRYCWHCGKEL